MNALLSGEENRLPLEEIEKLLIQRNAPAGTVLFQAHYFPAWFTNSTISFLIAGESAEVTLYIWSPTNIVDFEIAENLTLTKISLSDNSSFADQPQWVEERSKVPQNLARRMASKMRQSIDLIQPDQKNIEDGLMVEANMLVMNQRANHIRDHEPEGLYFKHFWRLCYLAMSCLEDQRSLKYLITLTKWLIKD